MSGYVPIILLAVCFCANIKQNNALAWGTTRKIDCQITHWGIWGNCERKDNYVPPGSRYAQKRTRSVTPPKNGGKPCPSNIVLEESKDCKETQYMATLLMASLSADKYINVALGSYIDSDVTCPVFKTGDHKVLASGACRKNKQPLSSKSKKKRDILLILDGSADVSQSQYEVQKKLAISIVTALQGDINVGEEKTRIAMMTFGKHSRYHFVFNQYFDKDKIFTNINSAIYVSQQNSTCPNNGLIFAKDNIFLESMGSRLPHDAEKIALTMTTGCQNCPTSFYSKYLRDILTKQGVSNIFLNVGNSENCLEHFRDLSDGSRCFQTFNLDSWRQVNELSTELETKTFVYSDLRNHPDIAKCDSIVDSKPRDVLFLLEESSTAGQAKFEKVKNLAAGLVMSFQGEINLGVTQTRVGVSTFNTFTFPKIDFDQFYQKPELISAIKDIMFSSVPQGMCLAQTFQKSMTSMFVNSKGNRNSYSADRMMVVISHGCESCGTMDELKRVRETLQVNNIMVYHVHIGSLGDCIEQYKALSDGAKCFQLYNVETWEKASEVAAVLESRDYQFASWKQFDESWKCQPIIERIRGNV